ncbi:hypothetical protein [Micromonospora sp. NPDC005806]|uniref:hypothetical protein n=1 Tax=Micromonospora sp. NPDC005806 TaxID=3364234 RepID=UPI0036747F61
MIDGGSDSAEGARAPADDGRIWWAVNVAYIRSWREDVTACLDRLLPGFEVRCGYPPGRHVVGGPAGEEELASLAGMRLSDDLLAWYRQVREVSLPDIGNGYLIHEPGLVACREVTSIRGRFAADVVVFASDGGGTLFAVETVTGAPVYRLPPDEVVAGVYHGGDPRFDVVAENLTSFLDRLRGEIEVFAATGAAGDL